MNSPTDTSDDLSSNEITDAAPAAPRSPTAFIWLLFAGLFMITGICVLLFIGREKARIIGQTITEMDIQPLLNVEEPITQEDVAGKVLVMHFWGFWCEPCAKEYPDFVKVQEKYKGDAQVLFASISCSDKTDDTKDALVFYTKKFLGIYGGSDFPVYWDPVQFSRTRLSQLMTAGGFSYPTTLVMDGEGKVVDVWRLPINESSLSQSIEKAKRATTRP